MNQDIALIVLHYFIDIHIIQYINLNHIHTKKNDIFKLNIENSRLLIILSK